MTPVSCRFERFGDDGDMTTNASAKGMIFDLDGTLYRGREAVPGAADFLRLARERQWRILFMTNRANRAATVVARQLRRLGMPCDPDDVFTSAQAAAACLAGQRVYTIGEPPMNAELEASGCTLGSDGAQTVLVGFDRTFNYRKLTQAMRLIRGGARFVATNPDNALLLDDGWHPGTGSIVAAVTAAAGQAPLVIGKPERRMVDLALKRLGVSRSRALMIGDNLETDIAAGMTAGVRSVLMLTGVSSRRDVARSEVTPTWIVKAYDRLTAMLDAGKLDTVP